MSSSQQSMPVAFAVRNNQLCIGGITVSRLAERVGQTPFYAYDRGLISARISDLRHSLPEGVHLYYAIKANPMPAVIQHLAGLVDGFDVASAGELKIALDTTISPHHISFAGPGKRVAELRQAVAAGVLIHVESERELRVLSEIGLSLGIPPRVAIRINPDFELKSSGMKMGGGPKPFGIDVARVPGVLARLPAMNLAFEGFHIYAGSQNLHAPALSIAHEKIIALAIRLAQEVQAPIRILNLGGGFGIPYFPGEQPLNLTAVGERLRELLNIARRDLPTTVFIIELGRFIVGEAGIYVCRVLDRKISCGQVFLVTDGGLHHHLAASGNFGQIIRKNYPVVVATQVYTDPAPELATVVGPLCTPLDLLADKVPIGHAQEGDLIAILQSGAYGLTASPTAFLGHPVPGEVIV